MDSADFEDSPDCVGSEDCGTQRCAPPHLAQAERQGRFEAAAEAALAKNWEERKAIFTRAQLAEDEGRLSRAVELRDGGGRATTRIRRGSSLTVVLFAQRDDRVFIVVALKR